MKKFWVVFSVFLFCSGVSAFEQGDKTKEGDLWYSDIEFDFIWKEKAQNEVVSNRKSEVIENKESKVVKDSNKWSISAEIEKWSGYTQYEIGGTVSSSGGSYNYRFPISRLRFFLDTYVINLGVSYTPSDWSFSLNYKTNLTRNVDKMQDSDWGYFYYEYNGDPPFSVDSLDVYSESESKMVMHVIDFNFDNSYFRNDFFNVRVGAGVLFQYFKYVCSDTLQWYPSYSNYVPSYPQLTTDGYGFAYFISGDTITYELYHLLPYIKIQVDFHLGGFGLSLLTKLAPLSYLHDYDDHLVRSKESTSNDFAYSVMGEGMISYTFYDVTVGLTGEFMVLGSEGQQEQVSSSGTATIEHKTFYWQYSIGLRLSYLF